MIAEVNKIIGNALIKDGGLYLPEIGSLSVTTTTPSLAGAKSKCSAPKRTIVFSAEERHRSLVLMISEIGNCTEGQAAMIYEKWRKTSATDLGVEIDGVGAIAEEVFTPSAAIIAKLNPVTPKSETVKSKSSSSQNNTSKGVIAAIVAVAAAVVIGLSILLSPKDQPVAESPKSEIAAVEVAPEAAPAPVVTPEPEAASEPTPAPTAKPAAAPQSAEDIFTAAFAAGKANSALRYKVIYGAFSTTENAARAVKIAERRANNTIKCTIYNHGKSYIVSLYDTNDAADAQRFIGEHKALYKESLWIHKR